MARSTRFAGPNEPLQIYQDNFFEDSTPMISHAPMPSIVKAPRKPLGNSNRNVVLNPPSQSSTKYSPSKASSRTSTSPLAPLKGAGSKLNMFSMAPPSTKGQNTDSLHKRQPFLSKFKTVAQKPSIDAGMSFGKENVHPQLFPAPPTINFDSYNFQKAPGKRMLMDAAPIEDSRSAKKPKVDDLNLPAHDSFPKIVDDGTKPGHSYATLIGMAILRSPNRRLTLAQIYKWISDTYSFYNAQDAGWQNSIRHNLSLHKAFIKIERPKDDPGKGNYWGIEPGMEQQFIKEKPSRKSASSVENLHVMSTRLELPKPPCQVMQEPTLPPPAPITSAPLPALPTSQATMSMPAELSSDATIPNSDVAAIDDALEKAADHDMPVEGSFYSPLPAAMHSSPPIPRHHEPRSNTPPPVARVPVSSINRSHKRKFASMDDSGYISSLESSAMRPNPKLAHLTSEADRPRVKRNRAGRAEDEIARLRASSYDSPSKGRSFNGFAPPSSSPLRQEGQMLPPLTPAVKFRVPPRPPPSVSPNTNLRIHRDRVRHMLQSPLRKMTGTGDETTPWSPAFNLDDSTYFNNDLPSGSFDIFQDFDDSFFAGADTFESPTKRSTKRARLDRSHSANAISDLTNSASGKSTASASHLKVPNQSALFLDTPSKVFEGLTSPEKLYMQSPLRFQSPSKFSGLLEVPAEGDWPPLTFDPADFLAEDVTEYSGLDILQGFEKIGSGSQSKQSNGSSKPPFGRSYSTAF